MKTKWKILLPVGLTVFALVCIFGGQALVKHSEEQRLAELKARNSVVPEVTPSDVPENIVYTLPPVVNYTLPPATTDSSAPSEDKVEVDEEGNITITPNFESQESGAVEVVKPDVLVTANVGGGDGEALPTESDGAYHGESQPPAATPSPAPTATPKPTPPAAPTPTPKPPEPAAPPETAPVDTPEPDNGSGGPPDRKGAYDWEISPDGKYIWDELASKWFPFTEDNGGTGGKIDDSDYGWNPGEGGETVGSFG